MRELYGRHGSILARPGQHGALLEVLLHAADDAPHLPGCRMYLVSLVPDDADAIAVTEVWDDKASHDASPALDSVRRTIGRARPFIQGFGPSSELRPVGGLGL